MSELIRRQDALDAFGLSEKTRKYGGDHSGYDTRMLYEIQDILESLPSAEPEMKWIPVTEALPDEEKEVLVSVHFDGYKDKYTNYPPSDYVEIASYIDGVWSSIYDDFKVMRRHHHIVAWMPTPEPYRGDE